MQFIIMGNAGSFAEGGLMGWSFRKSIKLGGGLRLNLSKFGIGISGGVRGARLSVGPRGARIYGGRGPFRYQKQVSGDPRATGSDGSMPGASARADAELSGEGEVERDANRQSVGAGGYLAMALVATGACFLIWLVGNAWVSAPKASRDAPDDAASVAPSAGSPAPAPPGDAISSFQLLDA